MDQRNNGQWDIGMVVVIGLGAIGLVAVMIGKLIDFASSQPQFVGMAGAIGGMYLVYFLAGSRAKEMQEQYQKEVDAKLVEFEEKISRCKSDVKDVGFVFERLGNEIKFMQKSFDRQWNLCEKTIEKVDELLKQKTPVHISVPEEPQEDTQDVHEAVEEVVGGAI